MDKFIPREVRKYLYAVFIALVPVAVYFGWIDVEASVVILPLILALLNLTPKDAGQGVEVEGSHNV